MQPHSDQCSIFSLYVLFVRLHRTTKCSPHLQKGIKKEICTQRSQEKYFSGGKEGNDPFSIVFIVVYFSRYIDGQTRSQQTLKSVSQVHYLQPLDKNNQRAFCHICEDRNILKSEKNIYKRKYLHWYLQQLNRKPKRRRDLTAGTYDRTAESLKWFLSSALTHMEGTLE